MNNYKNVESSSLQVFFNYNPEQNAIYISPTSANYGYILPISERALTSNTYTFIYEKKRNYEMFIAPISCRKHFSKAFVSYKKYNKKLKKYLSKKRSKSYTNIIEIPKQTIVLKKSHTYSDFQKSLGGLNKIMEIFNITDSISNWPIPNDKFKESEPLDDYFFSSLPEDFVEDFGFGD
jgi:hypothetical protein